MSVIRVPNQSPICVRAAFRCRHYKCYICRKIFQSDAITVAKSMTMRKQSVRFAERFSRMKWTSRSTAAKFMTTRKQNVRMMCHKICKNEIYFNNHVRNVHDNKEAECQICHKNMKSLNAHRCQVHDNKEAECKICHKKLKNKRSRDVHRAQ